MSGRLSILDPPVEALRDERLFAYLQDVAKSSLLGRHWSAISASA